jgi:hypothetical protein
MKKTLQLTMAALAWLAMLATPSAKAWTYQNGDVLLIFRGTSPQDDVEFDIGSVNQFLNQANGYTASVTGWDPSLVVSTLGQVSNANVILAATTSSSAWLSSSANVTSVSDVTASTFLGNYYDVINAIGTRPTSDDAAVESNAYVIQETGGVSPNSSLGSYYYIVTGGGVNTAGVAQLGGVPFLVQGAAPATLGFWQIQPTNEIPKPAATYVGTFTIDGSGDLTFVAGPLQQASESPQIHLLNGPTFVNNGQATPVNFGSVLQNQAGQTLTFTVTNAGAESLVLTNITVPSGFTLDTNAPSTITNFPFTIAPLGKGTFSVQLVTTVVGTNSGAINIINNDPTVANSTFSFDVTGIIEPPSPQIQVISGNTGITNGQTNAVNFGSVQQTLTTNLTFTVTNTGTEPLILTNITVPSSFALDLNSPSTITNFPFTIAASSAGTFIVQFIGNVIGTNSGNIVITNNDPSSNGTFNIPITGQVTGQVIALSGNLSFGVVTDGSSAPATLTISNAGNATLTVSNIIYPVPAVFGSNFSGTIAAGQSQQVTVTFSPTAATNYSGLLTVVSDATSGTSNYLISAFGANDSLVLTIITNGDGTVTPNDAKLIKPNTKVTLKAVAGSGNVFSGWTGSADSTNNPLTFIMASSTIVQANFITNPFLPFVGTYNGLFTATNGIVAETNAGLLKGLTLTPKGTYSGVLLINGESKSISGSFDTAGAASKFVSLGGQAGNVEVALTLTSNEPAPQVTGTISGVGWVATNLIADRATSNSLLSTPYTLLIPSDTNSSSSPTGSGYALISGTVGTAKTPATAKITGALADGTTFSQTTSVSQDGYVPIYANLYSSKGLVLGWINLTNASGATLAWVHPPVKTGLFTSAFTSTNPVLLSPWANPPASSALPTNVAVVETTDNAPVATNDYTLTITNRTLAFGKATGPTPLTGTIATKTGLVKVTIGSGAAKATGYGVILPNGTNGGGYFLTKTNAGAVIFNP